MPLSVADLPLFFSFFERRAKHLSFEVASSVSLSVFLSCLWCHYILSSFDASFHLLCLLLSCLPSSLCYTNCFPINHPLPNGYSASDPLYSSQENKIEKQLSLMFLPLFLRFVLLSTEKQRHTLDEESLLFYEESSKNARIVNVRNFGVNGEECLVCSMYRLPILLVSNIFSDASSPPTSLPPFNPNSSLTVIVNVFLFFVASLTSSHSPTLVTKND